jgi:hypothetical protein
LIQRTFARPQRTAVAASARLPASPLARPLAVLQISSARTLTSEIKDAANKGGIFADIFSKAILYWRR